MNYREKRVEQCFIKINTHISFLVFWMKHFIIMFHKHKMLHINEITSVNTYIFLIFGKTTWRGKKGGEQCYLLLYPLLGAFFSWRDAQPLTEHFVNLAKKLNNNNFGIPAKTTSKVLWIFMWFATYSLLAVKRHIRQKSLKTNSQNILFFLWVQLKKGTSILFFFLDNFHYL